MLPILVAVATAFPWFLSAGSLEPRAPGATAPARPGELLLRLSGPPTTAAEAEPRVSALARRMGVGLRYVRPTVSSWHLVHLDEDPPMGVHEALKRLQADPEVVAAQANLLQSALRAPDDPRFDQLWGFAAVEAESAWEVTVGRRSQRVGVVDSGTTRGHRDLVGRVARGWDFIRSPAAAQDGDGRDDDDGDASAQATHFHGTHVAGTILARADDGFGVPGLNWRAGLVSARALGRGGQGDLVDIVEAAAWMAGIDVEDAPPVGEDRVSVINLSLGSRGACSAFERDAYGELLDRGVVLVAAAGNTGNDTAVGAPANCPGVIAVGAVDADLALASYSAFSARIDVLAPGGDDAGGVERWILSLDGGHPEDHAWLYGTSMAAPHVTGVVSLMQAVAPDLEPAMIRDILQESPWTCEGCDEEALLQADHAVTTAHQRQQELDAQGDGAVGISGAAVDDAPPSAPPVDPLPEKERGGCEAAPATALLLAPLRRLRRKRGTTTSVRPKA